MDQRKLLAPKEAAEILGMSRQTITAMVKLGAPVHRWGPTGRRYKIDPEEFDAWQDDYHARTKPAPAPEHGPDVPRMVRPPKDTDQMAKRRHDLLKALA